METLFFGYQKLEAASSLILRLFDTIRIWPNPCELAAKKCRERGRQWTGFSKPGGGCFNLHRGRELIKTGGLDSLCNSLRRITKREIKIDERSAFRAAFMWVNTDVGENDCL